MIYYVVKFVSNNIYSRGKNKIVIISSALWLTYTKTVQKVLFYCRSSCKIRHKLFPRLSEDIYCKNTTSITTVCKRKAVIKMKLKLHFLQFMSSSIAIWCKSWQKVESPSIDITSVVGNLKYHNFYVILLQFYFFIGHTNINMVLPILLRE